MINSFLEISPFLLTGIGLVGLVLGLMKIKALIGLMESQVSVWWVLFGLVFLFIVGYLLFMGFMLHLPFTWTHFIGGLIFSGGGGFVALVTAFSHRTIHDIQTLERIKQLNKKLLHDVNHDELTGLYRRHYFIEAVNIALQHKQLYQKPAVILYIDLNEFKQINDTYGHLAGDQVLIAVAELFRQHFRKGDVVARLGGDEFVVLMNETDLVEAKESQARLLEYVTLLEIPFDEHKLKIAMSIGVAEIQTYHQNIEEIIEIADKYCYQSKPGCSR